MTARERITKVLNFEKPQDRLPMIEWATWWDKTYKRWQNDGLDVEFDDMISYFGLDDLKTVRFVGITGEATITDMASYEAISAQLYTDDQIEIGLQELRKLKEAHEKGDFAIRIWLDGFFWFPRSLMGIENHMYAFYDHPELMHRINDDVCKFNQRALEAIFNTINPDMIGFGEDMSYNHGPMLSQDSFDEFLAPYYRRLIPYIKKQGVKVLIDSDGDIMPLIPWLVDIDADGIYPLERQSHVDVAEIRRLYPNLLMLGAYDKLVMSKGEKAMREEFERLLPVMRMGGFIPSVDHQTPPEVSLENYRIYLKLFKEYCEKAVK